MADDPKAGLTVRLPRSVPMNDFLRERFGEDGFLSRGVRRTFEPPAIRSFLDKIAATQGAVWIEPKDDGPPALHFKDKDMTQDTSEVRAYKLLLAETRRETAEALAPGRYSVADEKLLEYLAEAVAVIQQCLGVIRGGTPPSLKDKLDAYNAQPEATTGVAPLEGAERYRVDPEGLVRDRHAPLANAIAPKTCRNAIWHRTGGGPRTGCEMMIGEAADPRHPSDDGRGLNTGGTMSRCQGALGRCAYGVVPGYGKDTANAGTRPPGAPENPFPFGKTPDDLARHHTAEVKLHPIAAAKTCPVCSRPMHPGPCAPIGLDD